MDDLVSARGEEVCLITPQEQDNLQVHVEQDKVIINSKIWLLYLITAAAC